VDAGTMANRFFSQCQKREAKKFIKESKAKNYLFISFLVQINEDKDKDKDNNTNNIQKKQNKKIS
jgi:hypothetical protein